MVVIAIFRVIKAPFIDGNLSIIDCYAEAVHVFRNFVHVIKNRLVGAPVHVIEKTVHVHENCCSRVLRILSEPLTDSTGPSSQILKGSPNKSDTPPLTNLAPEPIKEPVKEPRTEHGKKQDASRAKKGEAWKKWIKVEKPAEVPDDLWKQFGEIRALKKMALTESALELLRSEGEKAHMTLLQVIEHCCANAWAGFRAFWLTRANGSNYRKPQNVTQTAEYRERLQACCRGEGRNEKLADDGVTIIVD